jgi:Skp family chaperone for outer membrane proteins
MQHLTAILAWSLAVALLAAAPDATAQAPAAPQPQPRGDVQLFGPQAPPQQAPGPRPQQTQQQRQTPPRQTPPQQQSQQPQPLQPAQQQQQPPQRPVDPPEPTPQPLRSEPFDLPPAGTMVVVVDLSGLQTNSNAGQMIRYQIERARNQLTAESGREETQLRNTRQEIERQQPSDARNNRIREFERRVQEYETRFSNRRQQLEQVFGEAVNQFQRAVGDIIGEIVQEKQYLIVMNREAIIGFNTSLDITPEVMRRLNIRLPQVQVPLPQTGAAPAPNAGNPSR